MQLYWKNVYTAACVGDFLKAQNEWSNKLLIKQENAQVKRVVFTIIAKSYLYYSTDPNQQTPANPVPFILEHDVNHQDSGIQNKYLMVQLKAFKIKNQ